MKKIFYLVFLISLYFLVNVNAAEAEEVKKICYYRTGDPEITFAVKNYSNGKADAILMNPYSIGGESKTYGKTWDDEPSSLIDGECAEYMKYNIKTEQNNISYSNYVPLKYENDYILKNYDLEDVATKCNYRGVNNENLEDQVKLTVLINGNSIFTYFEDDINTAMEEISKGIREYRLDSTFYGNFLKYFENQCPNIFGDLYDSTIYITAVADNAVTNFSILEDSIIEDKELKNYSLGLVDEIEGISDLTFYVKVYESGTEKICVDSGNGSLTCLSMNSDETDFYSLYDGGHYEVRIKPEDVEDFFQYSDSNDYSSLKEPPEAYFNLAAGQDPNKTIYYLSKENDGTGIPSSDPMDYISSEKYKQLLSQLKAPLSKLDSSALDIQLTINTNKTATLGENITEDYALCEGNISDCTTYAEQLTELGLKNIQNYCIEVYNVYPKKQNDNNMQNRMEECISFNNFYRELVKRGIILDLSDGCGIISEDFAKKLNYFLDLIKIAGPLLALGLGTLDFVKTIVSGDADKEMKTTFKRFSTRLIAAVLLFLIPFILAFLLDLFIGNENGYDSDNPFCDIVNWEEQ